MTVQGIPPIPSSGVVKALADQGFAPVRRSVGHIVLRHPDGRIATVPGPDCQDVKKGTLLGIFRQARIGISSPSFRGE